MWITTKFESLMMPAWHQKAIDLCSEGKALQIAANTVQYFYCQANVLLQAHHTCLFSQMVVWFITMEEEEGMPASSK